MGDKRRIGLSAAAFSGLLHVAAAAAIFTIGSAEPPGPMPTAISVARVQEGAPAAAETAPSAADQTAITAAAAPEPPKPLAVVPQEPAAPAAAVDPPPSPVAPEQAATPTPPAAAPIKVATPQRATAPEPDPAVAVTPAPSQPEPVPEPRPKPRVQLAAMRQEPAVTPPAAAPPPATPAATGNAAATPAATPGDGPVQVAEAPSAAAQSLQRFVAAALGPNNPKPSYPLLARRRGLQGKVVLRAEVLPSGETGRVSVIASSGSEILDHAAEAAVQHWHFVPARAGDQPVPAELDVPVVFRLSE